MTQDSLDSRKENCRLQELLVLGGGSREFVADLLLTFKDQTPELLLGMKVGCHTNNAELAERSAHKMKGSCRDLGFETVQHLCHQFEILSGKNDIENASKILVEIELAFPRVELEISDFLKEPLS